MSVFDLYILQKYIFIPLLLLCIPILWGTALQCKGIRKNTLFFYDVRIATTHNPRRHCFFDDVRIATTYTTPPPPPVSEQSNIDYIPFLFCLPKSFFSVCGILPLSFLPFSLSLSFQPLFLPVHSLHSVTPSHGRMNYKDTEP